MNLLPTKGGSNKDKLFKRQFEWRMSSRQGGPNILSLTEKIGFQRTSVGSMDRSAEPLKVVTIVAEFYH